MCVCSIAADPKEVKLTGGAAHYLTVESVKWLQGKVRKADLDDSPLAQLLSDLLPDEQAAELDEDQGMRYGWWCRTELDKAVRKVEQHCWEDRRQKQQQQQQLDQALALSKMWGQANLGGSGGRQYSQAAASRGQVAGGSRPASSGAGASNPQQLLQALERAAASYKGPDGRPLCLTYLRAGYKHRDDSMSPPRCSGECGKAHARLPDGAVKVGSYERRWVSSAAFVDTQTMAVHK